MSTSGALTCAQFVEIISDYIEGALPLADKARVEEHLEVCPGCVYYLDQLKTTIRLTGRLRPEDVSHDAAATLLAAFRDWNAKS
jgi:anti-sigma factor RsiW